jgi:Zn-dependent protease
VKSREIGEFVISAVVIGLAFGIAMAGGRSAFGDWPLLALTIAEALAVVAVAFILHELGHRIVARRYGFSAEYRMWLPGLMIAIASSFFGFIFAAPGGIRLKRGEDDNEEEMEEEYRKETGIISLAGPITNLGLSILFIAVWIISLLFIFTAPVEESTVLIIWDVIILGVIVNLWLALFNLLPFWTLDGIKVFRWSKTAWALGFLPALGLGAVFTFLPGYLSG